MRGAARLSAFLAFLHSKRIALRAIAMAKLTALVKAHHMEQQFQWFSFVKGLESSSG
jgi:hypothetical protein